MKFNIDEVSRVVAVTPSMTIPYSVDQIVTSISLFPRKRGESSEQNFHFFLLGTNFFNNVSKLQRYSKLLRHILYQILKNIIST